jgi:anthranilate synthase
MIVVQRSESVAAADAEAALFSDLDGRPGAWMGCDVVSEGLFQRASMACAVPALRFCLDGATLTATALTPAGAGLLAAFEAAGGKACATHASGRAVVAELRRFLALFAHASPELALFGALSFDYFRLGDAAALPDDGRRRLVLYFPERVLVVDEAGSRWVDFRFSGIVQGTPGGVPQVRIESDRDELPPGGHAKRVAEGIARLRRGELHSLVLSQTFRRRTDVAASEAFGALRARNPYPGMFFCNLGGGEILFGASPDLQVRGDAGWVEVAPVCGTLRRGADPVDDAAQAFALLASEKEGSAIALCADSAAAELAQVCEVGSVEVVSFRRPFFFSTIIHAVDHLRGRRRAGLDGFDLLLAHATPATVAGWPKPEAVRAIAALEADWRGWYAGAVARIGTDGSVEAYTVLRAARIAGGIAEIRTGGNILVDSDPGKEEDETRLKAETLFRVLAGRAQVSQPVAGATYPLRGIEGSDPFGPALRNALARAGCVEAREGVTVLSGVPSARRMPAEPLLAIGEGALWLLEREGARVTPLAAPESARTVAGDVTAGGFLAGLGSFAAGWYALRGVREGALPANWVGSALSESGWILAAQHRTRRACALLFRPESVLSMRGEAGLEAIRAALAWLQRDMFGRK